MIYSLSNSRRKGHYVTKVLYAESITLLLIDQQSL